MNQNGTQVLDRTFDILEIIAGEKNGLSLSDITNSMNLSKSTVHRILSTLCNRGFTEKTFDKKYKLGLKMLEFSSTYLNDIELKIEARSFIWDLTKKMGMPVHLAIRENMDVVYIDKVDVKNNIRIYSQIGKRVPVYCTALGKTLLGDMPKSELLPIFHNIKFYQYTEKTVINEMELLIQVETAKFNGWSLDDEEHELGIRCIAAPIYDYRGCIIAAISISGTNYMLKKEDDFKNGNYIAKVALDISKRIGYGITKNIKLGGIGFE
ncbi:MAG: IclR family transcriptional regulator [Clostridiales bacterium]